LGEEILYWKRKKGTSIVDFKVSKREGRNRFDEPVYRTAINVKDAKQLAQMLEDLKVIFSAPVDKAFQEMKKNKSPFW